ncbi:MAG TPA: ribonuclease P protein subunit [Thermoplasmata archaeon]|nr:ribonuclease P protein subunit [Thermoplasmata archaeon]
MPERLAGEILGSPISIDRHPGLARLPLQGTLVDETLETFVIRTGSPERVVRVSKRGASGTVVLDGRPLPLNGDSLRVRPEDRTKRLLGHGRRAPR